MNIAFDDSEKKGVELKYSAYLNNCLDLYLEIAKDTQDKIGKYIDSLTEKMKEARKRGDNMLADKYFLQIINIASPQYHFIEAQIKEIEESRKTEKE